MSLIVNILPPMILLNSRTGAKRYMICDYEDYADLVRYPWYYNNGYAFNKLNRANRYILTKYTNENDKKGKFDVVCHLNGNTLDVRRANLKWATHTVRHDIKMYRNNTSGYTGVYRDKRNKKFLARIMVNGKEISLGRFDNMDGAVRARRLAEEQYLGSIRSVVN